MIDHALAYATRGWPVFPIEPRGKKPLTANGCKAASTRHQQIAEWWERWPKANIGLATGRGSGLLVVDLDGAEGLRNWLTVTGRHDGPWRTLAYVTGSGGLHLLYEDSTGLPNRASRLADNIDTRGEGGYIVVPPSIHPNGNSYRLWEDRRVAAVPEFVRRALRPPASKPRIPAHELFPQRGAPASGGERDWLSEHEQRIADAREGTRNATLNRAAYLCGRDVAAGRMAEHEVIDRLSRAAHAAGLSKRETERTIASGLRSGMAGAGHVPAPDYWPRRGR